MRPLIAGNWKMHGLSAQLAEIDSIATLVASTHPPADVLICTPATLVAGASHRAAGRMAPSPAISAPKCSKMPAPRR